MKRDKRGRLARYVVTPEATRPRPKQPKNPRRHERELVLLALLLLVALSGLMLYFKPSASQAPVLDKQAAHAKKDNQPVFPLPRGDPQHFSIPSVGIEAPMAPVDYPADGGALIPPLGVAAWYSAGPKPGYPGPAVIVGHLDSKTGPNVFWNLHKVKTGDKIIIDYPHQTVTFEAIKTGTFPQDHLPKDKIWNKTDKQVLRLVTCIGDFNYSTRRYSDNFIVYARETSSKPLSK